MAGEILLLSDYDLTISNKKGKIDYPALGSFNEFIQAQNINFILNSGRQIDFLHGVTRSFVKAHYLSGENGSAVAEILPTTDLNVTVLVDLLEREIINKLREDIFKWPSLNKKFFLEHGKLYSLTLTFYENQNSKDALEWFMQEVSKTLPDTSKITCVKTHDGIDVFGASVSKKSGLDFILNRMNKNFDKIIYCGDSGNDCVVAEYVRNSLNGIVIAPQNVTEDLLPYVNFIGNGEGLEGVVNALSQVL